ncbi:MAG: carbohydrate kinase [Chitinivibrionales bacterium]|nr:carbohydrate kinase [Chitinivibrionales bacterium]
MPDSGLLLGFDIGSSSVKATLMDSQKGSIVGSATSPKRELEIIAHQPGWAEQHPDTWWEHAQKALAEIKTASGADLQDISAIGISYQMHGLVLVDKAQKALRPSIIWCDSRAVSYGEKAFAELGAETCLSNLLNSPGNFTASKLAWVKEHEPDVFGKIDKLMLPGDYIAMKLTGELTTTPSGLSEGIMWNFKKDGLADFLLDYYGIPADFIPEIVPTFSNQGTLTAEAAAQLGLKAGTLVAYRGGDQPNNALSLNVLNPGEIAATAGTSGVVYGVGDAPDYDPRSRVNTFVHVNHAPDKHRYGVLLCVNGTGILNSWMKHNVMTVDDHGLDYAEMNALAGKVDIGSNGLAILPFGNGAERTLGNKNIGASIHGLEFNQHTKAHLLRAAQEGIVFALNYGVDVMKEMGLSISTVRAGHANMFLSDIFAATFASVADATVELYNTDGSQGAARGAGIGSGVYASEQEAFSTLKTITSIHPDSANAAAYQDAYQHWLIQLQHKLNMGE